MAKILVAEDDKFLANAYRVKLSKTDHEIKIVSDGQEVMDILETFTPDIILLDLIMPVKDGFSVLEELKKNEKWKNIPVIVASNLGQKEDIDRSMLLGATDYIVKSDMHINDILIKINNALK
ncbi:MAG: hypothetical protein A3H79_02700 [Candidatus Levybacteria bacterium RIFCSPLOWO2_02_FULL_36_8b]|nr:MAG: hypothetical protein A3H79_02700 [Candidatus Levybacteria bacterium RIFCSPLOWO2_02_FULL_36_8b]